METIVSKKLDLDIGRMLEDYEFSKDIVHPTSKGNARETALRVILENYLPDEFGVSQNVFLIDTEGTTSDECDLVIYRKNAMKNVVHNDIEYIPVENAMPPLST